MTIQIHARDFFGHPGNFDLRSQHVRLVAFTDFVHGLREASDVLNQAPRVHGDSDTLLGHEQLVERHSRPGPDLPHNIGRALGFRRGSMPGDPASARPVGGQRTRSGTRG